MNRREDCERDEEGEEHVEALREALDKDGPVVQKVQVNFCFRLNFDNLLYNSYVEIHKKSLIDFI